VIDCAGWPRYTARFRELFDSPEVYTAEDSLPESPESVVITGSTSNITDGAGWIDPLIDRTREWIDSGVPVLGICFGHQIIGKALGARVERMPGYEIGYLPIEVEPRGVMRGLSTTEHPFSVHQERVLEIPECLRVTARTSRAVQAFEHRSRPVHGVQFHPELTPEIAQKSVRTKDFDAEREQRLLDQVNQQNFERAKSCLRIVRNFQEVASTGGTRTSTPAPAAQPRSP
jgi:GMP synthase (glutamine-hydrolysing)